MGSFLLELFFPSKCLSCGRPYTSFCKTCTLKYISPTSAHATFSLYPYNHKIIKKAIYQLKYKHQPGAALSLISHAAPYIHKHVKDIRGSHPQRTLYIVPIPLSRAGKRARGYNQSLLLAKELAKILCAKVADVLYKSRDTKKQTETKSKAEREINIQYSMCSHTINPHAAYILIDDVLTTGATCIEAKRALEDRGARFVFSICLSYKR